MCGLAGLVDPTTSLSGEDLAAATDRMAAALEHRGPDDAGVWTDSRAGVGLGSRRLAIIDLSEQGHQPMHSADGRYVIAYNGEIYNHLDLRSELLGLGHRFCGHSDTEVMLAAINQWGVEPALTRFHGMFAFALWDRTTRSLHLGRDRMGEKPLYYGWSGRTFLFGSELKAMRALPGFRGSIDRRAVALYFRHKYIPTPLTIYEGFRKVPPGTLLTVSRFDPGVLPEPRPYWSLAEVVEAGARSPFEGEPQEAAAEVERLLLRSVSRQMVADVPVGAFLSGGVDSSAVVALMQSVADRPVRTFTVRFDEASHSEADEARAIAGHLGSDHTEVLVDARQTLSVVPEIGAVYDEPFADSSQVPTYLICRLARQHVTVALSGDGGDELFCGYNRYRWTPAAWRRVAWAPRPVRAAAAACLTSVSPATWDRSMHAMGALVGSARQRNPGEKIHRLADLLRADRPESVSMSMLAPWGGSSGSVVVGEEWNGSPSNGHPSVAAGIGLTEHLMQLDTAVYLPDDILTKVDRASMATSLEVRVPILDHSLVEFAWRLPLTMKLRDGVAKWPLRQVLLRHVPASMVDRPKMGFGVPLASWLRGPLRDWAEDLLSVGRLRREGYVHPAPIRRAWAEHLAGRGNWQYHLWAALMFESWLSEYASSG
jgi:asparagine synthase (glutamine-hydrolysing)